MSVRREKQASPEAGGAGGGQPRVRVPLPTRQMESASSAIHYTGSSVMWEAGFGKVGLTGSGSAPELAPSRSVPSLHSASSRKQSSPPRPNDVGRDRGVARGRGSNGGGLHRVKVPLLPSPPAEEVWGYMPKVEGASQGEKQKSTEKAGSGEFEAGANTGKSGAPFSIHAVNMASRQAAGADTHPHRAEAGWVGSQSNLKAPTPVDRLLSPTNKSPSPHYLHALADHSRVYQTPTVPQKSLSSPTLAVQRGDGRGGPHARASGGRTVIPLSQLPLSSEMEFERKRIREREAELEMELWREEEHLRASMEELRKHAPRAVAPEGGGARGRRMDTQEDEVRREEERVGQRGNDRDVTGVGARRVGLDGSSKEEEAEVLIRELQEDSKRSRQERKELAAAAEAASAKVEGEKEKNKRLAAEIEVLLNVRRRQDQEAADMLMQLAGSTRQLTFVQKDLVLLRAAWNDMSECRPAAADPHQRHRADEMERLLDKLQDDVSHWQLRLQLDDAESTMCDEASSQRSRDLLADVAYKIDEDEYGEGDEEGLKDGWEKKAMEREMRLVCLEDRMRNEAASVRKAAATLASKSAFLQAERERMLALTENLKAQHQHLSRAIAASPASPLTPSGAVGAAGSVRACGVSAGGEAGRAFGGGSDGADTFCATTSVGATTGVSFNAVGEGRREGVRGSMLGGLSGAGVAWRSGRSSPLPENSYRVLDKVERDLVEQAAGLKVCQLVSFVLPVGMSVGLFCVGSWSLLC